MLKYQKYTIEDIQYKIKKMANSIIAPEKMELTGDLVTNWQDFKDGWENIAIATELYKKEKRSCRCNSQLNDGQGVLPNTLELTYIT